MSETYTVLLFYKYVRLDEPAKFAAEHRELCRSLHLKGRVLVAHEGINGTLAGTEEQTGIYQKTILADARFADMEFKISTGDAATFPRLMIKVRPEIVTLGAAPDLDVARETGTYLSPAEWKRMVEEDPEVVLFDARNRYESDVGKFAGAITPPLENFRELPALVEQYAHLKDKKLLMYCTGGIRCEKASALFRRAGFEKVYQLHGGIMKYCDEFGDAHWQGDCFVFDQRMTVPIASANGKPPIGRCAHTGRPTGNIINCLHDPCHRLFVVAAEAIVENPDYRLCPNCRGQGLTSATADYPGSPARVPVVKPKRLTGRRKRRASVNP